MVTATESGIFLGDCLEVMRDIPAASVDLVLCDLPYGTTACKWDTVLPFPDLWEQYSRIIKGNGTVVLFGTQPFTSQLIMSNLAMFRYTWTWEHNRAANFAQAPYMPLKSTEDIVVFSPATIAANSKNRMKYNPQGVKECDRICNGKKANDHRPNRKAQGNYHQGITGYPRQIINFPKDAKPVHPTQKPVALLEYLIKTYTGPGDTVLDNCMGSGSTGVACLNTGRQFIGIEKDPRYFEIAKERMEASANARGFLP